MRKLNCVLQNALGANRYIMLSQVHALQELGHNVIFWEPDNKPAFDLFYEVEQAYGKVDFFFGNTWRLDRSLVKCLLNRPYVKIVCRAPHLGDWDCDRIKYPIQFADHNEVELVKILSEHPNFNHLTCQYPDDFVQENKTHNGWEQFGLKVTGIPLGTDCTDYFPTELDKNFEYDVCIVGGAWGYKLQNMANFVYPLCYPNTSLRVLLAGDGWSGPSAVGRVTEDTARRLYTNSICSINIHEPHSAFTEDINQRYFHVPSTMGFEVVQKTAGMERFYTDEEMFYVNTPKEMLSAVVYFSEYPEKRIPYILKSTLKTYSQHTNYHRLATLAILIDESELANKSLSRAMEIYQIRQEQLISRFG